MMNEAISAPIVEGRGVQPEAAPKGNSAAAAKPNPEAQQVATHVANQPPDERMAALANAKTETQKNSSPTTTSPGVPFKGENGKNTQEEQKKTQFDRDMEYLADFRERPLGSTIYGIDEAMPAVPPKGTVYAKDVIEQSLDRVYTAMQEKMTGEKATAAQKFAWEAFAQAAPKDFPLDSNKLAEDEAYRSAYTTFLQEKSNWIMSLYDDMQKGRIALYKDGLHLFVKPEDIIDVNSGNADIIATVFLQKRLANAYNAAQGTPLHALYRALADRKAQSDKNAKTPEEYMRQANEEIVQFLLPKFYGMSIGEMMTHIDAVVQNGTVLAEIQNYFAQKAQKGDFIDLALYRDINDAMIQSQGRSQTTRQMVFYND